MSAVRYNVDVTTLAVVGVAALAGLYVYARWSDITELPAEAARGTADFFTWGTPLSTEQKPPSWFQWYPDSWYGSLDEMAAEIERQAAIERGGQGIPEIRQHDAKPWWKVW